MFLPARAGGGQQAASWPGRQRGKRAVWLPNEPLGQTDPGCSYPQSHYLLGSSPCCTIGQWLGVAAETLTSACPLAAVEWEAIAQ